MFRSFVSLLTLFAMLLHAALGCCWYHAHAQGATPHAHEAADWEQPERAHANQAATCSHGTDHHHEAEAGDRASQTDSPQSVPLHDGHQHEHEGCPENTSCNYLAPNVLKVPTPADGLLPLDWLPTANALTTRLMAEQHRDRWWADSSLAYAVGPRVRDLTQAWLL